ncbi:1-acyl-sn-glycerol-3-phosphate acyltransferase [candidate division WOR-3 bacterium]|nr:1-acyl-sn-glycerol-3-phosphate acyltransferase [candidate division WOR-3 bacterium]
MLYSILHIILKVIAAVYIRLQTIDIDNIPKRGGVILAPNHPSDLDSFILGIAITRQLHTMGKEELFRRRFAAFIFKKLNAFPVKREKFDRESIRVAVRVLKDGHVIDMYPEGTVSIDGSLQDPKLGTAYIALYAKVPVVPAAIIGTFNVMSKGERFPRPHKVVIKFGKPLYFDEYYDKPYKKEILKFVTMQIMNEIKVLLNSDALEETIHQSLIQSHD